jgi:hypothetical protein
VRIFLGIALIVLGLAIAILPVFTDCQSQGSFLTTSTGKEVSMKCHWAGVAEIVTGAALVAVGSLMLAIRRKTNLFSLGIIGVILGAFTIMLPNNLIGVCQAPTMICRTVMNPALTVFGSVVILCSLGAMVLGRKAGD